MKMKYELLGKIKIEALRKSSRKKYTMAQKAVLAKSNAKLQKFNEVCTTCYTKTFFFLIT